MKKFLPFLLFIAPCAFGQATCSQSDVQAAITAASEGGTGRHMHMDYRRHDFRQGLAPTSNAQPVTQQVF